MCIPAAFTLDLVTLHCFVTTYQVLEGAADERGEYRANRWRKISVSEYNETCRRKS